ncbi:hypothetical protein IMZ11_02160 [Microtetraspora sp. AC03309]|uniref:hypothetical protein n=1 Tax=Microtetraspora sp. AC03309 TaxID=2779376 RepID=UPI001E3A07E1|nr:hypothetical protein [Microtetraspora sp. AC03309]MCC5574444.1 hypothetical protein [Microtetraspora sp. AC03309]
MADEEVSDAMLAERLKAAAQRVRDGEAARAERALLIDEAGRRGWTREEIAALAGVTHQAVTKRINKGREADTTE